VRTSLVHRVKHGSAWLVAVALGALVITCGQRASAGVTVANTVQVAFTVGPATTSAPIAIPISDVPVNVSAIVSSPAAEQGAGYAQVTRNSKAPVAIWASNEYFNGTFHNLGTISLGDPITEIGPHAWIVTSQTAASAPLNAIAFRNISLITTQTGVVRLNW